MLQYMIFSKQKTFFNQVKALNKGQIADTELIWRAFQGAKSQENISYFCLQLFEHVLHSQKKVYLIQNQEKLYATLLVMQLIRNKKPKSTQMLEECRNFIEKKGSGHGKSLMQLLFRSDKDDGIVKYFMSRLVLAPTQIDWTKDIGEQLQKQIQQAQKYKERINNSFPHKAHEILKTKSHPKYMAVETKLLTFGYICFCQAIKAKNHIINKGEYEHMVEVLKFLMHASRDIIVVEEYLMSFIHLIIKCITFYGCQFQDIIRDLMVWIDKLRFYPGSIGILANQLFIILFQQLKVPGTAFRKKLRKDFPSLDIKQSIFINRQYYFITDQQELYGSHEDQSLTTLRKIIIVNSLKASRLAQKQMAMMQKYLKNLNQEATFVLYDKIMKIFETVAKLDDIIKIQQIIKQYIPKLLTDFKQRDQKNFYEKDSIQSEQFQIYYKKINQWGFFQYPNYQIKSIHINDFITQKDNVCNLEKIVEKNKADYQGKAFQKHKIPLIFNGDGYAFAKFLKTFAEFQAKNNGEQSRQFSIYYIPKHENSCRIGIARYLACKDFWYRKFVFNVHAEKTLYPHLQINQSNKDLFPYYLFKKNIQLFLREANYTMPVRVYKCSLKLQQVEEEQIIYMSSFFMMGLFCQAKIIKMLKEKQKGKEQRYQNKQILQIIEQKIKKVNVMNLSLQLQCLQPLINSQGRVKKQKNIKIEDIQICNVSYEYFMGKQPNCGNPYLQMTMLSENNGKIFRKQIGRWNNFKQGRNQDQIFQAFHDLFICRTIKTISIQNLDKGNSLRLMIDGNIINRVEKIRIQPAVSQHDAPIVLPIQSFLPVS